MSAERLSCGGRCGAHRNREVFPGDVEYDGVDGEGGHGTTGEDGVEITVLLEVVLLLHAGLVDEIHGFFELVLYVFVIGCEREEERMKELNVRAVFDGAVKLHVGLAGGDGYIVVEDVYAAPGVGGLLKDVSTADEHDDDGCCEAVACDEGDEPDLGFDVFDDHGDN